MNKLIAIIALALTACTASTDIEEMAVDRNGDPLYNQCDVNEDLRVDADGTITHGISQCAICARIERAYDEAAARLGCGEAYPFNGCPLDEGRTDCLIWQVDTEIEHLNNLTSCEDLQARTGQRNSYTGFECGSTCRWTDGFANPDVSSTVPQNDPLPLSRPATEHNACEFGTAYENRRDRR